MDYDVIIAGAGPGGMATAARLQQHGRERVLVLERYRFPRDKPCGGGLTGHANQVMAELDLELDVDHFTSSSALVRYGSFERRVSLHNPVHVIRREEFDASLVAQVRARGVEIVEGEGVKGYDLESDCVVVRTSKGRELRARVLVGADGAASVVRKRLVGSKALPHRLFRMELTLPAGRAVNPSLLYDFSLMPRGLRGYLWVFPVPGGRINVGVMHYPAYRMSGIELIGMLREHLAGLGIELPERGTRGWPAWGYHPRTTISEPRVVTVGDAAGIDGLTGEGIAIAMEHAVVAGDAIHTALTDGDMSFDGYCTQIRRAIVGRELALDRWLARLLYRGKLWRYWLSLVLYDPEVLEMYAARIAGSSILADKKPQLYGALMRHLVRLPSRRRMLAMAELDPPRALPGAE